MDTEARRMMDRNPRLTVDEIRAGRNPNGPGPGQHKGDRDGVWLNPRELAATDRRREEDRSADANPVRRTLTDPPSVLRKTARGGPAASTFEPQVDRQQQDANPMHWLTRQFRSSDED